MYKNMHDLLAAMAKREEEKSLSHWFGVILGHTIVGPLLRVLIGIVFAWIVGVFFGSAILGALAAFGVTGLAMWQLGALLGFIAAFIK